MSSDESSSADPGVPNESSADEPGANESSEIGGIWDRLRALEEAPRSDAGVRRADSNAVGADEPWRSTAMPDRSVPGRSVPGTATPDPASVRSPFAADQGPATQVNPAGAPDAGAPGAGAPAAGPGQYYIPAGGAPAAGAPAGPPQRQQTSQPGAPVRRAGAPADAAAAYGQHGAAGAGGRGGPGGPQGPGGTSGRGPAEPQPEPRVKTVRKRKAWYRPKLRWFMLYLPLLIMAIIAGLGLWGYNTVKDLGRVDVGDALVPVEGDAVNYLIVGSDTREGADQEAPDADTIGDTSSVSGKRSDTIIVLRVEPERSLMMSIPRDLWATNVATGKQGRINGTFNQGPDNLIRSVTANLGIPINHYVEVDFVSFSAMVDAMGGITLDFPNPAYDPKSGLRVISDGPVVLDGTNALAYVRSRTYTEIYPDGSEHVEPTGDLGRQQRQQTFIKTVLKAAGRERNPLTLGKIATGAAKGVRVDQEIGFGDLLSLARRLGGGDPESRVLPTQNARKGNAAVLELINAEALPILLEFGAG